MKLPTPELAQRATLALNALGTDELKSGQPSRLVLGDGREVHATIPPEALELLMEVLFEMARGNAVTVVPVHAELTTQKAADLLNVSRPFLIGLLDSGRIPSRKVGAHRRVKLSELMAFKDADEQERRRILDELTSEGQKQGLGY